jgi:hypothetical protein
MVDRAGQEWRVGSTATATPEAGLGSAVAGPGGSAHPDRGGGTAKVLALVAVILAAASTLTLGLSGGGRLLSVPTPRNSVARPVGQGATGRVRPVAPTATAATTTPGSTTTSPSTTTPTTTPAPTVPAGTAPGSAPPAAAALPDTASPPPAPTAPTAGPPVASLVAEVEAAGVEPGPDWTWTMGDTETVCGVTPGDGAGTGCTSGAAGAARTVFDGVPTLALVAHELANAEVENDAVPSLMAEVTAAEAGSSWSPIDAVASCLVEHFMGFEDDAAGAWQCPAGLAAMVGANIHDTVAGAS